MQLEENKIYHMDNRQGLLMLPKKSANLIISDPPYFQVKGDFDFVWKSFDEYLEFMEEQAKLYKRVLADNGSLFVYGDRKNIAYVQTIFDKYFNFENHIYWQKATKSYTEQWSTLRSFYCRGFERILFYSNEVDMTGLEFILKQPAFYRLMEYFKNELKKIGWNYNQCDEWMGIKASYCYWDKPTTHPFRIPEKKHYERLQETGFWQKPYEELRQEYEELRQEYEELRRPFNNYLKLSDHWYFTNDKTVTDLEHDTVKPEDIARAMILTCTRPKDFVLVPFAGSGTECAMAAKDNRRFIGFETEKKYVEMATKRAEHYLRRPSLFSDV